MCNRSCIIVLLIVWMSQWVLGVAGALPTAGVSWGQASYLVEDLPDLVVFQANSRACWSPRRSRVRRRERRSRKPPCRAAPRYTSQEADDPEPAQPSDAGPETHPDTVLDGQLWGLSAEMTRQLPERLYGFWHRFSDRFATTTHDTSEYAYHYLRGMCSPLNWLG